METYRIGWDSDCSVKFAIGERVSVLCYARKPDDDTPRGRWLFRVRLVKKP